LRGWSAVQREASVDEESAKAAKVPRAPRKRRTQPTQKLFHNPEERDLATDGALMNTDKMRDFLVLICEHLCLVCG
jgi:hypothetical protein